MKAGNLVTFHKGFCEESELGRIYIVIECHDDVQRAQIRPYESTMTIVPVETVTYDMLDMEPEYKAFVASLTYDTEMNPITIEEAQYDMDCWKEEGSIEVPAGFTAEIYARLWNASCNC